MAIMMGVGIGLRMAGVFPDVFVAFFYTGLGLALAIAGIMFVRNFAMYNKLVKGSNDVCDTI